ncbi:argonaute/piwi family protein [Tellurirhabdus rosea]|uniref:argonaute/piwi family protein n=1 Tax=Tellurirhabdus rosea TaxID=2674997 RepID=UPI00225AC098|nr:hypothetical protein [Tellurirhabdus rosea]
MLEFPGSFITPEPYLLFDFKNQNAISKHPLLGLLNFGPYSEHIGSIPLMPTIRIGAIYPEGYYKIIKNLVYELSKTHSPFERKDYLPSFPGFKEIFKKELYLLEEEKCIQLPLHYNKDNKLPHIALAELLSKAVRQISKLSFEFDVLFIYLPESWSDAFEYQLERFSLHDYIKALTASFYIPAQLIREGSAISYKCRCSVAWRLSIALYVKSGGVPWRLAIQDEDTAIIGLSYSLRTNPLNQNQEFLTCCSQVFDSDGTGLEFIAYEADDYSKHGENPYLSRFEMRRVMQKSLNLYLQKHSGRPLRKIIIHKTTPFKKDEIEGCFDAFPHRTQIELLNVKQSTPWRAINFEYYKKVSGYPVNRGTVVTLSHNEVLLWTQGLTQLESKRNFYKEGKGIPSPIAIEQYAGSDSLNEHCRIIMGLTKMNWNHDAYYDRLPVTLAYASTLANTLRSLPSASSNLYQFKYFM